MDGSDAHPDRPLPGIPRRLSGRCERQRDMTGIMPDVVIVDRGRSATK